MTLMVIHSYLIKKNIYKYQKSTLDGNIRINFALTQHFVGLNSRLDTFLLREGREGGRVHAAFLQSPTVLISQRDTSKPSMQCEFKTFTAVSQGGK